MKDRGGEQGDDGGRRGRGLGLSPVFTKVGRVL